MIHGIINVYKERGFTSHDVVAKLRGILKQKKIGHTGTLDPDAEGVLPVCLGKATKLCDMLTDKDKTYRAVMLLGRTTDTQDTSGKTLEEREVGITEAEIRAIIGSFVGESEQIPPMYSALKVNGKKLCDLAREGKVVERKARPITIYGIDIEEVALPRVTMTVRCSKGTYIRTLCNDIGEKAGCGGCMEQLLRTKVSRFELTDALKLSEIEELRDAGTLAERIVPVDAIFMEQPRVIVKPAFEKLIMNGNPLYRNHVEADREPADGEWMRVYRADGRFLAIYGYEAERKVLKPVKMFLENE